MGRARKPYKVSQRNLASLRAFVKRSDQIVALRATIVYHYLTINCGPRDLVQEYGVSRTSVLKWVKRYKERGLVGLKDNTRTGRPAVKLNKIKAIIALRDSMVKKGTSPTPKIIAMLLRISTPTVTKYLNKYG